MLQDSRPKLRCMKFRRTIVNRFSRPRRSIGLLRKLALLASAIVLLPILVVLFGAVQSAENEREIGGIFLSPALLMLAVMLCLVVVVLRKIVGKNASVAPSLSQPHVSSLTPPPLPGRAKLPLVAKNIPGFLAKLPGISRLDSRLISRLRELEQHEADLQEQIRKEHASGPLSERAQARVDLFQVTLVNVVKKRDSLLGHAYAQLVQHWLGDVDAFVTKDIPGLRHSAGPQAVRLQQLTAEAVRLREAAGPALLESPMGSRAVKLLDEGLTQLGGWRESIRDLEALRAVRAIDSSAAEIDTKLDLTLWSHWLNQALPSLSQPLTSSDSLDAKETGYEVLGELRVRNSQ